MKETIKKLYDGIVLISIGIVLLLNITGYIAWGIWLFYLNFWPLLLIIAGIKLVLSIKKGLDVVGYIFQIILWLAVIFGGVYYYKTNYTISNISQEEEFNYTLPVDNADYNKLVNFDFNLPYGEFNIYDTDNTSTYLLEIDGIYTSRVGEPTIDKSSDAESITVSYNQYNGSVFLVPFFNIENNFDIAIGSKDISEFRIDLGAGNVDLDLRYSKYSELNANVGAGEATIQIGNEVEIELLTMKIGAGKVIIKLSDEYGYNITYNVGAGSVILEGEQVGGLGTKGNDVKSSNILTASKILNINADIGAGELIVEYASE